MHAWNRRTNFITVKKEEIKGLKNDRYIYILNFTEMNTNRGEYASRKHRYIKL